MHLEACQVKAPGQLTGTRDSCSPLRQEPGLKTELAGAGSAGGGRQAITRAGFVAAKQGRAVGGMQGGSSAPIGRGTFPGNHSPAPYHCLNARKDTKSREGGDTRSFDHDGSQRGQRLLGHPLFQGAPGKTIVQ